VRCEYPSAFAKSDKQPTETMLDIFENIGSAHLARPLGPEITVSIGHKVRKRIRKWA